MQISNQTQNDPLKNAVIQLVNAMAADFGDRYKQAFKDDEQVLQLKRRLYAKLKGLHIGDIYDGYELLVEQKPSFVPTVPEIVESVINCQKTRINQEKNQAEADRISLMPPKPEISESVARQNLKKIHELLGNAFDGMEQPETEQQRKDRLVRLGEKRLEHEEILNKAFPMRGKDIIPPPSHECHVGWCRKPGTMSNATTGNGNFYCGEHFKRG